MTLVDTSVWIDFFHGQSTSSVDCLEALISNDDTIAINGIILTECLQGIDDDLTHRRVHHRLNNLVFLPLTHDTFVAAADIDRSQRRLGITIRKTNDCIIAACAMENGCKLLHRDRDFDSIAMHLPLVALP